MRRFCLGFVLLSAVACGTDDQATVYNRLEYPISLEVRAPEVTLVGGCSLGFAERFCAEQYEVIGVIDVEAYETRELVISDAVDSEHCTNILWLRLVRLEEVGPVDDPGTLIALPAFVEVEKGAGALHSVAFPQATVRIDEIGGMDLHQARPPAVCSDQ